MNGFFFQIVLFLAGVFIGITIPLLPKSDQRWAAAISAVLLIAASLVWVGYVLGTRDAKPTTVAAVTPSASMQAFPPTSVAAPIALTDTPSLAPQSTREPTATPTVRPTATETPTSTPEPTATPALVIGRTMTRQRDGATMVYVPGGTFQMGSSEAEIDAAFELCEQEFGSGECSKSWFERESPQHEVTLDSFWIDKYEVTN